MFIPLVLIAWLYVALMMALAEATHSQGTVLGAIFTFLLFGVGPVALVAYIMGAPGRRKLRKQQEADAIKQAQQEQQARLDPQANAGDHTPADPVSPERKEL
jgi:membrane protein implicated in regulation of membrane protease activity